VLYLSRVKTSQAYRRVDLARRSISLVKRQSETNRKITQGESCVTRNVVEITEKRNETTRESEENRKFSTNSVGGGEKGGSFAEGG